MQSIDTISIEEIVKQDVLKETGAWNEACLRKYWLEALNRTLKTASSARFYRNWLGENVVRLQSLEQLADLPFTTSRDIIAHGHRQFWAASLNQMSRIVTLQTSGSTGTPKRICFTDEDITGTLRFFATGMGYLTRTGTRALIFMPGNAENGVSDLLVKALARIGVDATYYGLITDFEDAANAVLMYKPDCVVGVPLQILRLAYLLGHDTEIKTALLSSDSLPAAVRHCIAENLECEVFDHYSSTEMGYGTALECGCHSGMHLRESELYFEAVDPKTGIPVSDGECGELVFTTLTRIGMPLIRYRTGDIAKIISEPCPCGSILRRISPPERMPPEPVCIRGKSIALSALDDALLSVRGVVDFLAVVKNDKLTVKLWTMYGCTPDEAVLRERLNNTGAFAPTDVTLQFADKNERSPCQTGKRMIVSDKCQNPII